MNDTSIGFTLWVLPRKSSTPENTEAATVVKVPDVQTNQNKYKVPDVLPRKIKNDKYEVPKVQTNNNGNYKRPEVLKKYNNDCQDSPFIINTQKIYQQTTTIHNHKNNDGTNENKEMMNTR